MRAAVVTELKAALAAARCASYVAGLATPDFAARELLLVALQEIDRATHAAARLGD